MLTWILALSLLALVLTWFMRKVKLVRRTRTPGLGPIWAAKHMKTLPSSLREWTLQNNVSGFAHIWLGPDLFVFAVDSDSAQFVLKHPQITKGEGAFVVPSILGLLGNSILTVDGEEFAYQRPLFKPAFNREAYQYYFSGFSSDVEKFLTKIKFEIKKNNTIDIVPWITKTTMDILGHSVFNYDFGLLDGDEPEVHQAFQFILDTVANPWYRLFPWLDYLPLPTTKTLHKNINIVSQFCKKLVEAAKKEGSTQSILTHMLGDSGLSFQKLQANLFTLLIAGHETTATAMSWALMELGNHQDVQAKLYDEIQRNFPNSSKPESPADFDKMTYLDAFISEVLRVHSPVSIFFSRIAKEDIHYKNQVIPKGVIVGVHFANVQNSPVYWKQPEKFDPDRFLPPNKLQPRDHIPFSAGPRQCLGKEFSLIEQRLILVRTLQEFQILAPDSQPEKVPIKGGVLNSPASLFVKLQPRN